MNDICVRLALWVRDGRGGVQRPERPGAKRPALRQAEGCTLLLVALLWSPEGPTGKLFFRRLIIFLIGACRGLLRRDVGCTERASVVWRCCELVRSTFVHIFPFLSASLPRRCTGSV
ncbi:hypothetical protein TcCL_ESM07771 [Trypanosoma cruzi]|nr:hypothetical protein TcCL_ESM07771 [Trypanosoma cruzi]